MPVKIFSKDELLRLIRKRDGEKKIGEVIETVQGNWMETLTTSSAKFVILGIPEDIGVRANQGRGGAHTAWKPAMESFLNQQDNFFLEASNILLLGEIEVEDLMLETENRSAKNKEDLSYLREKVHELDNRVASVMKAVFESGKTAIVIGGGHNNAYGNIKGASLALKKKINVLNCDPHLDFRALEGRHSGNGFSYAFEEDYLNKYAVLCMHEQYNNRTTLKKFRDHAERLYYTTYEDVFVAGRLDFNRALKQCMSFLGPDACGLELDIDAITNVPSSAKTSSGISPIEARQMVYAAARQMNCIYFHIAEAAPVLSHIKTDNKTGKLIAYLMSDFIKGFSSKQELHTS